MSNIDRSPLVESLEGRRLMAATLPSGFSETILTSNLNQPTSLVELPDGRMLVTQKSGALRVIKNNALRTTPALTLPVDTLRERGLLAVEADPNFASNHYIYLHYFPAGTSTARVSRFTLGGDAVVAGSEQVLYTLDTQPTESNHGGGAIHFGKDGKLYISAGDNSNGANSQSLTTTHGKILRINADGTIPADNPFADVTDGKYKAIYAIGLRNVFTFGVDRVSGTTFLNDVGEKSYEEINELRPGGNYGWPNSEGPLHDEGYDAPIYAYPPPAPGVGVSIAGGAFYTGVTQQFPGTYAGKYFFGDYVQNTINVLNPANNAVTPFATGMTKVVDIDVLASGQLAVTTYDNQVHLIKYTAPQPPAGASLKGFTFNDTDRSGTYNAGDGLASGKTVFLDADNDGALDAGEKSTTTAADGSFSFTGLTAGTYRVRRVFPSGYTYSTPLINVTVTAGQAVSGLSIGSVTKSTTPPPVDPPPAGTASIAGYVVNDTNGNGKWSSGEFGIANRRVWIDLDNDSVLDSNETSVLTNSSGQYKFTGLAAGSYKVRQLIPAGWQQTSPANGYGIGVTLSAGQAKTGQTFTVKLA